MIDEGLFVRGTALGKGLEHRIPDLRLLKFALGDLEIEFRQIRTVQVPDQIGRTKVQIPTDVLHFPPPMPFAGDPTRPSSVRPLCHFPRRSGSKEASNLL